MSKIKCVAYLFRSPGARTPFRTPFRTPPTNTPLRTHPTAVTAVRAPYRCGLLDLVIVNVSAKVSGRCLA